MHRHWHDLPSSSTTAIIRFALTASNKMQSNSRCCQVCYVTVSQPHASESTRENWCRYNLFFLVHQTSCKLTGDIYIMT